MTVSPKSAAALLIACTLSAPALAQTQPAPRAAALPGMLERANLTMAHIEKTFAAKGRQAGYYLEEVRPNDPNYRPHVCYAWGVGLQLSALVAGAKIDPPRYRAAMDRYINKVDTYWFVDKDGLGGYSASANPQQADRYYDDNAWIGLDYCDAYEFTKDPAILERAKKTMTFMLSGEDEQLGGGIFWHEQKKSSKNTCINAPAAVCALRLHRLTGEAKYLDVARRLYDWTKSNLQDPEDGLYYDNKKLDGTVDKTKFTYNTALMIRAACLFYDQTKDAAYLHEAERMAKSAEAKWFKPDGRVSDPSYFAHLLAEAMLDLGQRNGDPHWAEIITRTADFLWRSNRDPNGAFPEKWDRTPTGPLARMKVMWEASNARLFFRLHELNAKH